MAGVGSRRRRPTLSGWAVRVAADPGPDGVAGDHLQRGPADRGAVLDVAAAGEAGGDGGPGGGGWRAGGGVGGEHVGGGVDDHLVDVGVGGGAGLGPDVGLGDLHERVGQAGRGRPRFRGRWPPPVAGGGPRAALRGSAPGLCRSGGVGGGGAQRGQQRGAVLGRQPDRQRQRPVLPQLPGQAALDSALAVRWSGSRCGAPGRTCPAGWPSSARPSRPGWRRSRRRRSWSAPAPWRRRTARRLSPAWITGRRAQRPGDPDVLAGGAGRQLALPGQPRRCTRACPRTAQPRRASNSASSTRNRQVAAARCPAS